MTTKQALEDLRDKVKAGEWDWKLAWKLLPAETPYRAYKGSLDAAKALHEAVLPEFFWDARHTIREGVRSHWYFVRRGANCQWSENKCPARAWLLAILEALIEEKEK